MISIVFENENFIVCDKPAGVLSVPDRLGDESTRACLGTTLEKEKNIRIFPVHRLDFEVSGLIVYAKNAQAHRQSQDWFLHKRLFKTYLAVSKAQNFEHTRLWPAKVLEAFKAVELKPNVGEKFIWKSKILRGKKRTFATNHGDWAETHAELSEIKDQFYIWRLAPITGKPHQLRFEMSQRGFPLLGDELYGSRENPTKEFWPHGGLCLRAVELNLKVIGDRLGLPEKLSLQESVCLR